MCTIKLIIFLQLLPLFIAQNLYNNNYVSKSHDDNDIIIEPLKLILRSTDNEGIFLCNGRVEIKKQKTNLTVSIENPILASPKFLLKTNQINSTTIRIRIIPNGYIGFNSINCHWDNNRTYARTADLIIWDNSGEIILTKEGCFAYDRRYVQCILRASTIGRGFKNGLKKLYSFEELELGSKSYFPPTLVNITEENELIFHFIPQERNVIPNKILMSVNMTLGRVESRPYRFYVEPKHTTNVDFRIEDVSCKKFTIHINHNNTGTISQRLCSGYIDRIDDRNISSHKQDIAETSDQTIKIPYLHSSTQYEVCLRCYYEQTDYSYNEKKCYRITTTKCGYDIWYVIPGVGLGITVLTVIYLVVRQRRQKARKRRIINIPSTPNRGEVQDSSIEEISPPEPDTPLMNPDNDTNEPETTERGGANYKDLSKFIEKILDKNHVAPDTIDVPRQNNA